MTMNMGEILARVHEGVLDLSKTNTTNEDLALLIEIPELREIIRELILDDTEVTNEGVAKYISQLLGLQKLSMRRAKVTGASIAYLEPLLQLEELALAGPGITDDGMEHVARIPSLRKFRIPNTGVTDKGLACIVRHQWLEVLDLSRTKVTDHGLMLLPKLPWLIDLNLSRTATGDEGMVYVAQIKFLQRLVLVRTKVGNLGVVKLEDLATLRHLDVSLTKVTDVGVGYAAQIRLHTLMLNGLKVTDAGIAQLSGSLELRVLGLDNTKVEGWEFDNLGDLTNLEKLYVENTLVTEARIVLFRQQHPGCVIYLKPLEETSDDVAVDAVEPAPALGIVTQRLQLLQRLGLPANATEVQLETAYRKGIHYWMDLGLQRNPAVSLANHGVFSVKALNTLTEDEVLTIKGIKTRNLEKLKEMGLYQRPQLSPYAGGYAKSSELIREVLQEPDVVAALADRNLDIVRGKRAVTITIRFAA